MGEVSTIGLDIAKSVFQVHGVDVAGAVVVRKRVLTLMRHLLLIGGGPIGVASAYIKRFSNHPNEAQPTQE
ncbi:MAG: hypothetical protein QOJ15_2651 [Bradyrhizobium sp.]|jgi:transposase|nr:hypothetical protein [Bradyrhizobium sp.]